MNRIIPLLMILTLIGAASPQPALGQAYIKTKLSKKTKKIKPGMSREEVLSILGPPTWAILPSDGGQFSISNYSQIRLELRWDNGPQCLPVTVQFDRDHEVVSVGKGRTCDRSGFDESMFPTGEHGCWNEDRAEMCS